MIGTIGCQFDILERLQTSTVARMFLVLKEEKLRVIREAMTVEQRALVAERLRNAGQNLAAQLVQA